MTKYQLWKTSIFIYKIKNKKQANENEIRYMEHGTLGNCITLNLLLSFEN